MDDQRARHLDDGGRDDDGGWRVRIARALLVSGRILPLATLVVVVVSRVEQVSWASAPVDDAGFTTAWLPNTAFLLSFILGFAVPFIALPVGSSVLARRDGDTLTVQTVLGSRAIDVPSVRVWRAWLPGRGSDTQIALARSRTGWAVLIASESSVPPTQMILADAAVESGARPWLLYVRGVVLILLWAVVVFACLGLGGSISGAI